MVTFVIEAITASKEHIQNLSSVSIKLFPTDSSICSVQRLCHMTSCSARTSVFRESPSVVGIHSANTLMPSLLFL